MSQGYFSLMLHSHLPYVRHPEHAYFLEEQWFFEAMTETYIPLLHAFEDMRRDDVDFRLTLSISAPLLGMMRDTLLLERYAATLDRQIELGDREIDRTRNDPSVHRMARHYREEFDRIRATFRRYQGNIPKGLKAFQDSGQLDIITCNGTHMFMPVGDRNWASFRAHIELACREHENQFGRGPRGMWLAECGYVPGVDQILKEYGIRYFFVDTHGILFADRRPVYGVHAPLYCPSGVAAFGRDVESSKQVWSADEGYPGDGVYRDFYRDIGFDLDYNYIKPYIHPDGTRHAVGYKYHRITNRRIPLHEKAIYDPWVARDRAAEHAGNFLFNREWQVKHLSARMDRPPIIVAPYDAELYGHWWYEGPRFIEYLFRKMQYDQATVTPVTPSEYLAMHPSNQVATPSLSSWGHKGFAEVWLSGENDWCPRHLHRMAEKMQELAKAHPGATGLRRRALNQAARELVLAQASDWTFIMKMGTTVPYAVRRVCDHITRFNYLADSVTKGEIHEPSLAQFEEQDNLFHGIDYSMYAR